MQAPGRNLRVDTFPTSRATLSQTALERNSPPPAEPNSPQALATQSLARSANRRRAFSPPPSPSPNCQRAPAARGYPRRHGLPPIARNSIIPSTTVNNTTTSCGPPPTQPLPVVVELTIATGWLGFAKHNPAIRQAVLPLPLVRRGSLDPARPCAGRRPSGRVVVRGQETRVQRRGRR